MCKVCMYGRVGNKSQLNNKMLPRGGRASGKGFRDMCEISGGPIYMLDPKYENEDKKKELEELKKVFGQFGIEGGNSNG